MYWLKSIREGYFLKDLVRFTTKIHLFARHVFLSAVQKTKHSIGKPIVVMRIFSTFSPGWNPSVSVKISPVQWVDGGYEWVNGTSLSYSSKYLECLIMYVSGTAGHAIDLAFVNQRLRVGSPEGTFKTSY